MELLIPGLILVALMAYASTRIKKTAAQAFEPETIETDIFVIQKPEGFLNVIGGDPKYLFEAYTKEYGGSGAEDFRKATATLTAKPNEKLDAFVKRIKSDSKVTSDLNEVVGEHRYRLIESDRTEGTVDLKMFHKLAMANSTLYIFEVKALVDAGDEIRLGIETLISSFEIK